MISTDYLKFFTFCTRLHSTITLRSAADWYTGFSSRALLRLASTASETCRVLHTHLSISSLQTRYKLNPAISLSISQRTSRATLLARNQRPIILRFPDLRVANLQGLFSPLSCCRREVRVHLVATAAVTTMSTFHSSIWTDMHVSLAHRSPPLELFFRASQASLLRYCPGNPSAVAVSGVSTAGQRVSHMQIAAVRHQLRHRIEHEFEEFFRRPFFVPSSRRRCAC